MFTNVFIIVIIAKSRLTKLTLVLSAFFNIVYREKSLENCTPI